MPVSATDLPLPVSHFHLVRGAATNGYRDVLNSDLILMWGSNAMEAHPPCRDAGSQRQRRRGIPIIALDPRKTMTTRIADTWVRFNPSTHIALINSMMYWIIKESKQDKAFIEKRTEHFDDLKKTVENYADCESIHGVPLENRQGSRIQVC